MQKGVDFILNSKKPFPEWLKNHSVFKEMGKLDKIFPKIGLPNFKETCDIMNSAEAMTEAQRLGQRIISELNAAQRDIYAKLDGLLISNDKDRNEKCAKAQSLCHLIGSVLRSLQYGDYAKIQDGRVVLKLRSDIFHEDLKRPIFHKDEPVLRMAGKLWEQILEFKPNLTKIDQLPEFKGFSRVNVPNKKYSVIFAATGEEGAWDVATISMRGVQSCQSWNAPQSRGLIGSIASKYVGVIYLASDQEIPGYGSKMLNRCMVRFAINKQTKKPGLLMDNMYPNANQDTINAFKKVLKEKSGLDVVYTMTDRNADLGNYYIPDEPSRKFLKQGEFSYMDTQVTVQAHPVSIKPRATDLSGLTDAFKKKVAEEIGKQVKEKRALYVEAFKKFEALKTEFDAAKKKWEDGGKEGAFELVEPRMRDCIEAELNNFGKGGVINLLLHCDKKHGKESGGKVFAQMIMDSFFPPTECASKEEYHRKYIMTFLRNPSKAKEEAWKKVSTGTWMKSFPKSAERFFNYLFAQMKGHMVASCREMIKGLN